MRTALVGAEATQRLETLDIQRNAWQQRVTGYLNQRDEVLHSNMSDSAKNKLFNNYANNNLAHRKNSFVLELLKQSMTKEVNYPLTTRLFYFKVSQTLSSSRSCFSYKIKIVSKNEKELNIFCAAILSGLSVSATHATNAEQVKSSFVYSTYAQTKYPLVLTMVWRVLTELEQIRLVWTTGIRFFLILRVTEEMSGQQEFHRLTQLKFVENNLPNK